MDYKELVELLEKRGFKNGYALGPHSSLCDDVATAITDLLARAEAAETRAEKAERERDAAVNLCGKLIALCSPPKEWEPKLFRRHIAQSVDYIGCGYTFLDGFNRIFENFAETADDKLYTAIRDAAEKEIVERSMRMSGTKEE